MGVLFIKCPVTGKAISTGVKTDAQGLSQMPNLVQYAHCQHCMTDHAWRPLDAILVDVIPE
jgi:hypothetical protein